jgi:hypothetical protein
MCPFCWSSLGLMIAGVASTGGLTVLAVKLSRTQTRGENENVNEHRNEPENRIEG